MTAALVARGVIEDDYGVPASAIRWRCGPADRYDAKPIIRMEPRGVEMVPIGDGQNLSDMLRDGKLDAMVAYKPPKCFVEKARNVVRLFPDYVKVEQDYFARTRIFPIMHLVGTRVYRNPYPLRLSPEIAAELVVPHVIYYLLTN